MKQLINIALLFSLWLIALPGQAQYPRQMIITHMKGREMPIFLDFSTEPPKMRRHTIKDGELIQIKRSNNANVVPMYNSQGVILAYILPPMFRTTTNYLMIDTNGIILDTLKYLDEKWDFNIKNSFCQNDTAYLISNYNNTHTNIIKYLVQKDNFKFVSMKTIPKYLSPRDLVEINGQIYVFSVGFNLLKKLEIEYISVNNCVFSSYQLMPSEISNLFVASPNFSFSCVKHNNNCDELLIYFRDFPWKYSVSYEELPVLILKFKINHVLKQFEFVDTLFNIPHKTLYWETKGEFYALFMQLYNLSNPIFSGGAAPY